MPTTTNHSLPYPALTDVADGPAAFQALAAAIDALLPTVGDLKGSYQTVDHGGWLLCDGRNNLLRASYPTPFVNAMLAAGFTGTDGTHFGVPDLRGRTVVGKGTHADVDSLADNDGQVVGSRRPAHKHTVAEPASGGHHHTFQGKNNATAGVGGSTPPIMDNGAGTNAAYWDTDTQGSHTHGTTVGPQTNAPTDGPAYQVANFFVFAGS